MSDAQRTQQAWTGFGHNLRGFIVRRVAGKADADDILQEVFLRLHQRGGAVERSGRLGAWLYQVARNAIADHYRAPMRRREIGGSAGLELEIELLVDPDHEADTDRDPVEAQQELATCLRPMVERLTPLYREAVVLADLEGLAQREVAERLGLSFSGAKSRVQRGRRMLKAALQDCCRVELDTGGRVTDYEARPGSCASSGGGCHAAAVDTPVCGMSASHR